MMTMPARIICQNDLLLINGDLDFQTVVPLWKESLSLINKLQALCFDFSEVTHCNSAGVALMLEWAKLAKKENKCFSFQNIPLQLLSILQVSGVEKLLMS